MKQKFYNACHIALLHLKPEPNAICHNLSPKECETFANSSKMTFVNFIYFVVAIAVLILLIIGISIVNGKRQQQQQQQNQLSSKTVKKHSVEPESVNHAAFPRTNCNTTAQ